MNKIDLFFSNIKEKPSEILSLIRNNLSLIMIIPSFIGGIWQVVELMTIDISLVRFFSITQLVADGILALCMLIFVYLISRYTFFFRWVEFITKVNKETDWAIVMPVWFDLFIALLGFYLLRLLNEKKESLNIITCLLYLVIALFILQSMFSLILRVKFGTNLILKKEQKKSKILNYKIRLYALVDSIMSFLLGLLFLLSIILFSISSKQIRNILFQINNLENKKYILQKVESDFGKNVEANTRYFNDKYLFIKLTQKDKKDMLKTVVIYKIDDVFFKQPNK